MRLPLSAHDILLRMDGRYVNITWLALFVGKPCRRCRSSRLPKLSSTIPWQKGQLLGPAAPEAAEWVQGTAYLPDAWALGALFRLPLVFLDFIQWLLHYTQQ